MAVATRYLIQCRMYIVYCLVVRWKWAPVGGQIWFVIDVRWVLSIWNFLLYKELRFTPVSSHTYNPWYWFGTVFSSMFMTIHPVVWWYPIEKSNFCQKSSFKNRILALYIYLGRQRVKLSTDSRCFDFLFVGSSRILKISLLLETSWH